MEKTELFKAKPKLEYSAYEETVDSVVKKRKEVFELLQKSIEAIGQVVVIQERLKLEWERGNLVVTPEISAELDVVAQELEKLKEVKDKLSLQYDELSELIKALNTQESHVTRAVEDMFKNPDKTIN